MQIGFISCCVLSCHFDCFPSFVVRLRGYIHYQIQRRELKASGLCSSPQCDLIQLRKDLTHLKAKVAARGTEGRGSTSAGRGAGSAASSPALVPALAGSIAFQGAAIGHPEASGLSSLEKHCTWWHFSVWELFTVLPLLMPIAYLISHLKSLCSVLLLLSNHSINITGIIIATINS